MDPLSLTTLAAKLIGVGVASWKAVELAGWGSEEASAFEKTLSALPALRDAFKDNHGASEPLAKYCELVTVAFGEAWRRHWHNHEQLAPKRLDPRWWDWTGGQVAAKRIRQVHARLEQGRLASVALGDGVAVAEVKLLDQLNDPLRSPWYAALWSTFNTDSDATVDDGMPPLLMLERGGDSKARFEHHFRLAFNEGLTGSRGQPLVQWLDNKQGVARAALVRRLLAASLSRMRSEHIFGGAVDTGLPHLALEDIYVEPMVQRKRPKASVTADEPPERILGAIDGLLDAPPTRVVVVMADFGRGKSLTARTLAYRYAEKFLANVSDPTPEVAFPVFVRCQSHLRSNNLTAKESVRVAQRARLVDLIALDKEDPALELSRDQKTVVLLDGLDEVQLAPASAREFFDDLLDRASPRCRFVVFTRPAAVPESVHGLQGVSTLLVQDFDTERQDWLDRWSQLAKPPHPTVETLVERQLFDLCTVPVLLFMTAQVWNTLDKTAAAGRVDIYDSFVRLMAKSKLSYDQQHHPAVYEAAKVLARVLSQSGQLPADAAPEDALIEFQSRLAWRSQGILQSDAPRALTVHDVTRELYDLELSEELGLVERGVLMSMSTNLAGNATELHFGHESFREFFVAKYWEARLNRIVVADRNGASFRDIEEELYGARLSTPGIPQCVMFLVELLGSKHQVELTKWGTRTFNDETLSNTTIRKDERYALREAALRLAANLSDSGVHAKDELTLATLLASFAARGEIAAIVAPGLKHERARLRRASLPNARLSCANLVGADLSGADVSDADLSDADLSGANLNSANLVGANISHANLSGANLNSANITGAYLVHVNLREVYLSFAYLGHADLTSANLSHANLAGAYLTYANLSHANLSHANLNHANLIETDLSGADLSDANLSGADLSGANLSGANLSGADLSDANVHGAYYDAGTKFAEHFDPDSGGMTRVTESNDDTQTALSRSKSEV